MREWEYYSDAKDGHVGKKAQQEIGHLLEHLEGKRVRIRINVVRRQRSNQQNRYYWGVIVKAAKIGVEEMWGREIASEDAHELLKQRCNGADIVNQQTGEILRFGQTTTELNKLEAEDYYEKCRQWILEWFNITVPLPNEQLSNDLENV